jgi:ADP-ribosylglycohydrolase
MHDPLSALDLITDELRQRRESGFDVTDIAGSLASADPDDAENLQHLYESLTHSERSAGWAYEEPDTLADIVDSRPDPSASDKTAPVVDGDRILGSWLGRVAGCNLGKPVEDGDYWTSTRIADYLRLTGSLPLRDYIPAPDQPLDGYLLRDNWPHTTRGRVHGSDRDDDIDYAILGLHLVERHGTGLTTAQVADGWLAHLPYLRVYTAERATYVNLLHGLPAENAATRRNPYREWIGALIRGDIFGWTHPGRPLDAARHAYVDATLSHRGNGIYGAMWSAALVSAAFIAGDPVEAFDIAHGVVPGRSRLAEALRRVRQLHAGGADWSEALAAIQADYGHYSWVHTVNNAALISAGLLWSDGDFSTAVGNTVQGGWDTDSNGATVGSVMGALLGAGALPHHFIDPLEDRTRSAVFGYDNSRISELAARTTRLADRLRNGIG